MRPVSYAQPSGLTFRRATGTDVDAIVDLVESAYRGERSRAGWTTEADLVGGRRTDAAAVRATLVGPGSDMLLAQDPTGALLACCHVQRQVDPPERAGASRDRGARPGDDDVRGDHVDRPGDEPAAQPDRVSSALSLSAPGTTPADAVGAYFGMFAVLPTRQGNGLGDAMLRLAERHAIETWSATWMELLVIAQRAELIAWYHRRGYVRTGRTSPFPYDDERFGRPLRPDLYFVVLRAALTAR